MSHTLPSPAPSRMREEALSAPTQVALQLARDGDTYAQLAQRLRERPDAAWLTLARGSSDHAAHHLAYLVMARLGRPVTSLPMSLLTLYRAPLPAPRCVALALSQSGQSPDLVEPTRQLREAGATTVAIVNDTASPLAAAAAHVLPLHAGPERSVAATKSFIAQLVAGVRLLATWQGDAALAAALHTLPEVLDRAAARGCAATLGLPADARQAYIVARGPALAVALEVALKLKETCGLQAEAFSGAELAHGPLTMVQPGWPVLLLAPRGPAQAGLVALAHQLHDRGALVSLLAPPGTPATDGLHRIESEPAADEALETIAMVQMLYPMIESLARRRGRDPDHPPGLHKVTLTR